MKFEDAIPQIESFVHGGGAYAFPFLFIDPTGWSALNMENMSPLLRINPGEVLVNFMTEFIRRFARSTDLAIANSVDNLLGTKGIQEKLAPLNDPQDREDLLIFEYAAQLRAFGRFEHCVPAVILHPNEERSYFHLVYGTRSPIGLDVFKKVEKRATEFMVRERASAQQRQRVKRTRQPELFDAKSTAHSERVESLRRRYLTKAQNELRCRLRAGGCHHYDELWKAALSWPLVWTSDLNDWLSALGKTGQIEMRGLKKGQRIPRIGRGIDVICKVP